MAGQIYDEICWSICKTFWIMQNLLDFTDTIAWSGSSWVRIQCQQTSTCAKSTHNNFNCYCIIHDHMVYHERESSNLTIMAKLSHLLQAHWSYFFNQQKEHSRQRVQSGRVSGWNKLMMILMMPIETFNSCKAWWTLSKPPEMNIHLKLKKNNYFRNFQISFLNQMHWSMLLRKVKFTRFLFKERMFVHWKERSAVIGTKG